MNRSVELMVVAVACAVVDCGVAGELAQLPLPGQKSVSRAYAEPTLPVTDWQAQYGRVDAREWAKRWNGGIHGGWFGGDKDEVAKAYLTNWGPLGYAPTCMTAPGRARPRSSGEHLRS